MGVCPLLPVFHGPKYPLACTSPGGFGLWSVVWNVITPCASGLLNSSLEMANWSGAVSAPCENSSTDPVTMYFSTTTLELLCTLESLCVCFQPEKELAWGAITRTPSA